MEKKGKEKGVSPWKIAGATALVGAAVFLLPKFVKGAKLAEGADKITINVSDIGGMRFKLSGLTFDVKLKIANGASVPIHLEYLSLDVVVGTIRIGQIRKDGQDLHNFKVGAYDIKDVWLTNLTVPFLDIVLQTPTIITEISSLIKDFDLGKVAISLVGNARVNGFSVPINSAIKK